MARRPELLALTACAVLATALASAGLFLPRLARRPRHTFDRTAVMVPTRDGIKLQTAYFVPRVPHGPLPIILTRTPYGVPDDGDLDSKPLDQELYIFAYQNIRGRFGSEGEFLMQRPPRDRSDPKAVDESSDAYDTVDWLVKNVPGNSGKVCIQGTSYPGFLTAAAQIPRAVLGAFRRTVARDASGNRVDPPNPNSRRSGGETCPALRDNANHDLHPIEH